MRTPKGPLSLNVALPRPHSCSFRPGAHRGIGQISATFCGGKHFRFSGTQGCQGSPLNVVLGAGACRIVAMRILHQTLLLAALLALVVSCQGRGIVPFPVSTRFGSCDACVAAGYGASCTAGFNGTGRALQRRVRAEWCTEDNACERVKMGGNYSANGHCSKAAGTLTTTCDGQNNTCVVLTTCAACAETPHCGACDACDACERTIPRRMRLWAASVLRLGLTPRVV